MIFIFQNCWLKKDSKSIKNLFLIHPNMKLGKGNGLSFYFLVKNDHLWLKMTEKDDKKWPYLKPKRSEKWMWIWYWPIEIWNRRAQIWFGHLSISSRVEWPLTSDDHFCPNLFHFCLLLFKSFRYYTVNDLIDIKKN